MNKRILIYATAYLPLVGGAEVAVKEITDRLAGYDFDLITALMDKKLARAEKIGRVNVYRLGCGWPKFDKLYLALFGHYKGWQLHRQKKYDLVWAIMASFGGFAALSFKLKTKIPYLLTLQEGDPIEEILNKVKLVRGRFNEIFIASDALQPISSYLAAWGEKMGFAGKISEVIPNGVDVGLFTKEYFKEEIGALRRSFGFPADSVIAVTSSRLVIKNGVGDVIKALKNLPADFCFYICGSGPLENKLKQLTEDLHLEQRVKFGGYKSHDELPKILKAGDIFIRPSLSEGLGNSFLEAMAAGLPTIGTLVGGIPDFLIEGQTGLVCQPGDSQSIGETILRASRLSVEEKKRLHRNALILVKEKYNWDCVVARLDLLFNRLLNSKNNL
ncbi:MAG: glycosyltransferase family 4 protein [Candidatus Komeilibacteria bacterium]|nr:glycosyltransferase family 4 protein [Candidatus Komeilibacteria bacterium]